MCSWWESNLRSPSLPSGALPLSYEFRKEVLTIFLTICLIIFITFSESINYYLQIKGTKWRLKNTYLLLLTLLLMTLIKPKHASRKAEQIKSKECALRLNECRESVFLSTTLAVVWSARFQHHTTGRVF